MRDYMKYLKTFLRLGGNEENVKNMASHWLYGTEVSVLASQSKRGMVYNPPGH